MSSVYLPTKDDPLLDAASPLGMGHEILSTFIQSEPIVALYSLHKELDAGAFLQGFGIGSDRHYLKELNTGLIGVLVESFMNDLDHF